MVLLKSRHVKLLTCVLSILVGSLNVLANRKIINDSIYDRFKGQNISINVYNWGEYISNGSNNLMNVNDEFENITGIHVNYTTFSSNEELYAKLKSNGVTYDIIIPSDYMISKMIQENMLSKLDFNNIPNFKNIMPNSKNLAFDHNNAYSVPYACGVVGIIYNSEKIKKTIKNFDSLWDIDFRKNILMFSNSKDAFSVALMKLGYHFNTQNKKKILKAAEMLKIQKDLIQTYVMDEIYDKMQSGEAYIAPYYSGDALVMMANNKKLQFIIPKYTNRYVDAICVPKNSKQKEAAYIYINFLCEPQVALANALYGNYSTPNKKALDLLPKKLRNNKIAYPNDETLRHTDCYTYKSKEMNELMDTLWIDIMVSDGDNNIWMMPAFLVICVVISISITVIRNKKKNIYN